MGDLFYPTVFAGAIFGWILINAIKDMRNRGRGKLPPGPRRLPLIGNVHQVPAIEPWVTFGAWSKSFGDMIYLDFMGQPGVIINKRQIALDLLAKRAAIYSDRPVLHMVTLCGYDNLMVLQPASTPFYKRQRRIGGHDFTPAMVQKYWPLQEKVMRGFVRQIVEDPSAVREDMAYRMGIIIFRLTYGYLPRGRDDPFVNHAVNAVNDFSQISNPGQWLVDVIPQLKYLPRWMPGSGFLRVAEKYKRDLWEATFGPFEWCKANLETGEAALPNLVGNLLAEESDGKTLSEIDQKALPWAALSMLGGAMDTNISITLCFLMFMILNPEVQSKAQEEIDKVIGKERLPSMTDRPNLPYVRALIAETFRCGCPAPTSVPHALTQDDEYNGYFLPRGTWFMPNVWHMCNDPEVYDNPEVFRPERYNGEDAEIDKPKAIMFGWGRRTCLGRDFAEAAIFIVVSTILTTCDVLPGLDDDGKPVYPKVEFTNGSIREPKHFTLRLQPRSSGAAALLAEIPIDHAD